MKIDYLNNRTIHFLGTTTVFRTYYYVLTIYILNKKEKKI